jgi:hypothetical protein
MTESNCLLLGVGQALFTVLLIGLVYPQPLTAYEYGGVSVGVNRIGDDGPRQAMRTGFEPVISAVTGQRFRPLS